MNCPRLYAKFLSHAAPSRISDSYSMIINQHFAYRREYRLDNHSSHRCLSVHSQRHSNKAPGSRDAGYHQSCLHLVNYSMNMVGRA